MTTSVHADDPIPSGGLSQQEALEFALLHNQGLAATRSQADALGNVPEQANALPDPMLGFNAINLPTDTFDLDQEPMTQMQIALSQTFPFRASVVCGAMPPSMMRLPPPREFWNNSCKLRLKFAVPGGK